MASMEIQAYNGGPAAVPPVRRSLIGGSGAKPPEAESILAFICLMESECLCVLHITVSKVSKKTGLPIDFSRFLCHLRAMP